MKFLCLILLLALPSLAVADPYVPAKELRDNANRVTLNLRSHAALVYDERDKEIILARNSELQLPVASLTKLMTAMVILDAGLDMDEVIKIDRKDKDRIRYSRSRLRWGMQFSRDDLLRVALIASENRAALALARTYPGGSEAFVQAMNDKARQLGLSKTRFADSAGLYDENVSTADELIVIVQAASQYPLIRDYTTITRDSIVEQRSGRVIEFGNTNQLVRRDTWPISLSKTGYTSKAGNCLVMQTEINDRPITIILLESWGKRSKYGDSNRIRKWLLKTERLIGKI